jgi:hypothetical protein
MTDDAKTMLIREFAVALRRARLDETERMRIALYGLELLRDGLADLNAELRRDAVAAAHYPAASTEKVVVFPGPRP